MKEARDGCDESGFKDATRASANVSHVRMPLQEGRSLRELVGRK